MTTTITNVYDMKWFFDGNGKGIRDTDFGMHGYCTVRIVGRTRNDHLFDVYCQIDGDEVRIAREVTNADAVMFVNRANAEQEAGA